MTKVDIDIVSDVMCPWCYIGKRRLEKALTTLDDIEVEVRWRPYQLDATLPEEGRDRREYLETKFGGPEQAKAIYSNIENAGTAEGLAFDFKAIKLSPNTLNAHRVIRWAGGQGEEVQDRLVETLFDLFFQKGANIGDLEILADAAEHAGMDRQVTRDLLASDKDKQEVAAEIETAQRMGVTGVPCFIIENKYAVAGAQEPESLAEAIRQAAGMKEAGAPGSAA